MPDETPTPWDRRPKETGASFEAFRTYLELGPKRSLAKVAEQLGKSVKLMERWSRRHEWVARAGEHDAELARIADQEWMDATRTRTRQHAHAAETVGRALNRVATSWLKRVEDLGEDGLLGMTLEEHTRYMIAGARALHRVVLTERLARGMSTENISRRDGALGSPEQRAAEMTEDEQERLIFGDTFDLERAAYEAGRADERKASAP